jgi:predicted GNAT family N-acyltransferase
MKNKAKTVASLRLPPATKAKLQRIAQREKQSLSAAICRLVEETEGNQRTMVDRLIQSFVPYCKSDGFAFCLDLKQAQEMLQSFGAHSSGYFVASFHYVERGEPGYVKPVLRDAAGVDIVG